jgi:hypothetical protein
MTKARTAVFLGVWLLLVLTAFYGYFWRYIQVFDHQQLYPDGKVDSSALVGFVTSQIQSSVLEASDTLIFHWLNPDCHCTVFSGFTVDKLNRETTSDSVQHIIIIPPNKSEQLLTLLPVLKNAKLVTLTEQAYEKSQKLIPATPAAVVFNQKTKSLSYLGPHSSGVICGKGTGFVELVLNNLQHGFDPVLYELEQTGCFCHW